MFCFVFQDSSSNVDPDSVLFSLSGQLWLWLIVCPWNFSLSLDVATTHKHYHVDSFLILKKGSQENFCKNFPYLLLSNIKILRSLLSEFCLLLGSWAWRYTCNKACFLFLDFSDVHMLSEFSPPKFLINSAAFPMCSPQQLYWAIIHKSFNSPA